MKIRTSQKAGFTLVEIMITVAIIGMLSAIGVPNAMKARESAQYNSIINNLRIIESGKDQWALENKQPPGAQPTATNLVAFIKNNTMPQVVVGETYNINPVGTRADATTPVKLGPVPAGGTVTLP